MIVDGTECFVDGLGGCEGVRLIIVSKPQTIVCRVCVIHLKPVR